MYILLVTQRLSTHTHTHTTGIIISDQEAHTPLSYYLLACLHLCLSACWHVTGRNHTALVSDQPFESYFSWFVARRIHCVMCILSEWKKTTAIVFVGSLQIEETSLVVDARITYIYVDTGVHLHHVHACICQSVAHTIHCHICIDAHSKNMAVFPVQTPPFFSALCVVLLPSNPNNQRTSPPSPENDDDDHRSMRPWVLWRGCGERSIVRQIKLPSWR